MKIFDRFMLISCILGAIVSILIICYAVNSRMIHVGDCHLYVNNFVSIVEEGKHSVLIKRFYDGNTEVVPKEVFYYTATKVDCEFIGR